MTKPFSAKELLLRIEAIFRRSRAPSSNHIKYRDLVLDTQKRELSIEQEGIELTNLEFKLLHTFVQHSDKALDRDFLRDEVWGDDSINFHDKTINVAMNRLRKKIDPESIKKYFSPVWGVGYKLN
jgi:DNA-binding response OmpR family regulator